ncbi:MAG: DUF5946 family protein [Acidobacteriaceae bacterium]
MAYSQELFDELSFYTLAQPRAYFLHQIAIDTFTLQQADEATKPIALVFALVGLYLHVERGYSGLRVQEIHMRLASRRKQWPAISLPEKRGALEVSDVLAAAPGADRDGAIEAWCRAVWREWQENRNLIAVLLRDELGLS